jgi:hypothetical protein
MGSGCIGFLRALPAAGEPCEMARICGCHRSGRKHSSAPKAGNQFVLMYKGLGPVNKKTSVLAAAALGDAAECRPRRMLL